ncbi:Protein FAR1-RELATED SEQUENCE 5 [Striga hermonthica]|uniref:Protein FAR1-RELATED SEQUENCE 5 n=1 Tax=Striga hermonthica TaxID=68872 RepID=A0A9N7N508_STRHE|nr:Protein FAR1-RELATED SEQUENCE 5 [Striga hermonthica]
MPICRRNICSADCEQDLVDDAMHDNTISSGRTSNYEPRVGMIFNTLDEAWDCWQNYGKLMGFGVRINYRNKSQKDGVYNNAVFVCRKEGKRAADKRRVGVVHRWEERTSCKAKLNVVLERSTGKYKIKEFVAEHNHELEPPETSHMLRSHRQVSRAAAAAIDLAHDAGLTPKATHHLRIREAGGWDKVGYILEDQKTYLRSKREKNMVYDSRMIVDYGDFGDVITFDTTYGTNKELRPLGVFTGFNHHRQMVIFGGALLYDETADSFAWLFETFLNAHGDKEPQTIFTDQDAAMANALAKADDSSAGHRFSVVGRLMTQITGSGNRVAGTDAGLPGSSPEDGQRCSSLRCSSRKLAVAVRISAVWVHKMEVARRVRGRRSPPSSSDLSADRASGMAVALLKCTDGAGDKEKREEENLPDLVLEKLKKNICEL